ncbi:MAG: cytochrome C [Geminicoccaceae bacterium]
MRVTLAHAAMAAAMAIALVASQAQAKDSDDFRIARGLKIAPVPLNLAGLNRDLAGLGSYLVNAAGGCNDCHTNPPYAAGGDPFAGQKKKINSSAYLAGGVPFGPGLFSANLTPDGKGRPAGLTLAQFVRTMRTGRDQHDGHLMQVMPWPVYQDLRYDDLKAIYTYLRAIPSRPTPTPPS